MKAVQSMSSEEGPISRDSSLIQRIYNQTKKYEINKENEHQLSKIALIDSESNLSLIPRSSSNYGSRVVSPDLVPNHPVVTRRVEKGPHKSMQHVGIAKETPKLVKKEDSAINEPKKEEIVEEKKKKVIKTCCFWWNQKYFFYIHLVVFIFMCLVVASAIFLIESVFNQPIPVIDALFTIVRFLLSFFYSISSIFS